MNAQKVYEKVYETLVSEWGDREVYPLEKHEFKVLSSAPDSRVSDYDNGDGTVTTTVLYAGKKFMYTKVGP